MVASSEMALTRANAVLSRLPQDRPVIGAEVGVFSGLMSRHLLKRPDLTLLMVDSWEGDGAAYRDKTDWHARLSQHMQDHYMMMALYSTQFAIDRRKVLRTRSADVASDAAKNDSLDFVFIDADHAKTSVRADLDAWWVKVRPGGLMGGHDYAHKLFPGVKLAVDAFAAARGMPVMLGPDTTWFVHKGA